MPWPSPIRDTESGRRVPVGCWVYPGSNEKRDDVLVALAKRGVVLLGERTTRWNTIAGSSIRLRGCSAIDPT